MANYEILNLLRKFIMFYIIKALKNNNLGNVSLVKIRYYLSYLLLYAIHMFSPEDIIQMFF